MYTCVHILAYTYHLLRIVYTLSADICGQLYTIVGMVQNKSSFVLHSGAQTTHVCKVDV